MNGCHGKTVHLWLKAEEGDAYPRGVTPVRTLLQGVALCVHSCKEPVAKRSLILVQREIVPADGFGKDPART